MAIEFNQETLNESLQEDKPTVVDFWAEWCGPCKMVGPVIKELAEDYKDRAIVGKVNVDENRELAQKYGVKSIPTILFIKNGEVVDKIVGANTKAIFAEKLNKILN